MASAKWHPFCLGLNVLTHFMMKWWHENIFYITSLLLVKSTTDPQGVTGDVECRVLMCFFVVVVVSMNKLSNKQASCQCFDMQWCSSMWYHWNVLKENWLWKLYAFCKTCRKPSISLDNTETGRHWNRAVVRWIFHFWLHWKLSFWQLSVQPMMKILSTWQLSISVNKLQPSSAHNIKRGPELVFNDQKTLSKMSWEISWDQ